MKHTLETRIMRRVFAYHVLRRALRGRVLLACASFVALVEIIATVSVISVVRNMPFGIDLGAWYNFGASAVLQAERLVQLSLVVVTITLLFFLKEVLIHTLSRRGGKVYA